MVEDRQYGIYLVDEDGEMVEGSDCIFDSEEECVAEALRIGGDFASDRYVGKDYLNFPGDLTVEWFVIRQ